MDTNIGIKYKNDIRLSQEDDDEIVQSAESPHTTMSDMQELNEYCLLDIFSNESLCPIDLCSLAETCKRFKRIAQCVFPKNYEINIYCDDTLCIYKLKWEDNVLRFEDSEVIARILKNFGSNLSVLSMSESDPIIINSVAAYCSDGSLKRININTHIIVEELLVKFKLIFKQLCALKFSVRSEKFSLNPKSIKLDCDSLMTLSIYDLCSWNVIIKNTFLVLERFTCIEFPCCESTQFDVVDILFKFFARHKCLKTLSLSGYKIFRKDLAQKISVNCKELEELYLNTEMKTSYFDFTKLLCLMKLRVLVICIKLKSNIQFVVFLKKTESLEVLKMCYMKISRVMFFSLSQLKNLRELNLNDCSFNSRNLIILTGLTKLSLLYTPLSNTKILDIILHMTNLEELSICYLNNRNEFILKSYYDIVEVIEQRPNKTLKIKSYFPNEFLMSFEQHRQVKLINLYQFNENKNMK